jgi:hypothetical protein
MKTLRESEKIALLQRETPEERVSALSALRSAECRGALLAAVVALIDDDGSYEEDSYDWAGPAGYSYAVCVGEQAAKVVERVGAPAIDALAEALASGAGRRTMATLAKVAIGAEWGLTDAQLDALRAVAESRDDDAAATRLNRRLVWESRRREGGAAEDAHLDEVAAVLESKGIDDLRDAVWALGLATGSRRAAELLSRKRTGYDLGIGKALAAIGPVLEGDALDDLLDYIAPPDGRSDLVDAVRAYDDSRVDSILAVWVVDGTPKQQSRPLIVLRERGGARGAARAPLMEALVERPTMGSTALAALGGADQLTVEEQARYVARVAHAMDTEGPEALVYRAGVLVELGQKARELAPRLLAIVTDRPPNEILPAVRVLATMGELARPVVPRIAKLLSGDRRADATALGALERLGPVAEEATAALEALRAEARYTARVAHVDRVLAKIRGDVTGK